MATPERTFVTQSGVASQTGEPFVSLAYPTKDFAVMFSADDAIRLALDLMMGAAAARLDAAFLKVALAHGQSIRDAAVMLEAIRQARDAPEAS